VRAIITAPEFFSPAAYRAKVKSAFEYAASAVRILAAQTDGDRPMLNWIAQMGQPIFGKLTPNGYSDRSDEWLNSGLLIERLNFANALVNNQIKGTKFDANNRFIGIEVGDAQLAVSQISSIVLMGEQDRITLDELNKVAEKSLSASPTKPRALLSLVALAIGAPEFQRR
jgi:hypothetical protein